MSAGPPDGPDEASRPSGGVRTALLVVSAISFALTTTVNRAAGALLDRVLPGRFPDASETCIASCAVALLIYLLSRPRRPFAPPQPDTDVPRLVRIGALWLAVWLAVSALAALARGGWYAYTHGAASLTGFLALGPAGEELLFRGAIFELAERAFPGNRRLPVLLSTLLFSAHHLQLHGYRLDAAALTQMGFTLPMGWVFGTLRRASGSLWPGLLVHVLTNLPGAFGR